MKKVVMFVLMLVLSITIFAQVADDGPFGLRMGMSYDEVKKIDPSIERVGDDVFTIKTVPFMNLDFEYYILYIPKQYGLCKICAVGNPIETSAYGYKLKSAYIQFRDILKNKYSPNYEIEDYDYLHSGSIWNEPRDFMMSLLQKERVLICFITTNPSTIKVNDIENIYIKPILASTDSGCILIAYESINFELYKQELEQKKTNKF